MIDEQQIDRHFKEEDLRELYTFEPDIWDVESTSQPAHILPKDLLLADLLSEHPELVSAYHNHDSLLENRIDEGLSESERQDAWREYEAEKQFGRQAVNDYQLAPNSHLQQQQNIAQLQQQQLMLMQLQQQARERNPLMQTTIDRMFSPVTIPVNRPSAPHFGSGGENLIRSSDSQPARGISFE